MSQLLELLNKGDRFTPTTYRFGARERLNIHADGYADLTDADTGSYIRTLNWDGVRNMGYCPAKMLEGNTTDQHLDRINPALLQQIKSCVKYVCGGLAVAVTISIVGNLTGCTSYLLNQAEQDIATSTIEPRINSIDSPELIEFRRQNQDANAKLAKMRLYAAGGVK